MLSLSPGVDFRRLKPCLPLEVCFYVTGYRGKNGV
jgi:hypothetical protein